MVNTKETYAKFFILGLLLGFLFLQRTAGVFYIIVVSLYYLFSCKEGKPNKIAILFIIYLTICTAVGLHNLKRAGIFYIMPSEGNYSMYRYFAKDVLQDANGYTDRELDKIETNRAINWIENNLSTKFKYLKDLNLKNPYAIGREIKDERTRIRYYKYLGDRAFQILLENPIITIKKLIYGVIHSSFLNPYFVYYDYEYFKNYGSHIIGDFTMSKKHQELIPTRIIYTIFIYIICLFGVIKCFKKSPKITFLLIFSILYYYVILGWYGKTRLFVPALIYMSIFFGNGLDVIINKIKVKKTFMTDKI